MEILNSQCNMLTNFEVKELLESTKNMEKKKHKDQKNLATISYETLQYLNQVESIKGQTTEKIIAFRKEMEKFGLTRVEIYMMVNDPPASRVHLQLLIEECDQRLTVEQINEVLTIVQTTLLPLPEMAADEDDDADGDGDTGH